MTGKLIQITSNSKKPQDKVEVSRFSVYFRTPDTHTVVVNAKCFQIINEYTYFFQEDSKVIGRLLGQYLAVPESVAMFRSSDISHILKDKEIVGTVRTSELIQMDMILARSVYPIEEELDQ
jgi:hypothetical protein